MSSTKAIVSFLLLAKKNETKKGITIKSLRSDNDVVDGNLDEFDEKSDEFHDAHLVFTKF